MQPKGAGERWAEARSQALGLMWSPCRWRGEKGVTWVGHLSHWWATEGPGGWAAPPTPLGSSPTYVAKGL